MKTRGNIRRVTLRNLAAHKLRLLLTAVAVILGVSFVAGALIFTDTMDRQFDEIFDTAGEGVAVSVRAVDPVGGGNESGPQLPVPDSVLQRVRQVDGAREVTGTVFGFAAVVGRDGKVIAPLGPPQIGVDWGPEAPYDLISGRAPNGSGEVIIDAETAKKAGLEIGARAKIVVQGPPQEMTVVGLIDTGNLMGATLTAFDTPTAQRLLLKPGHFTEVTMDTAGPSERELRDRVAKVLPTGFEAVTGEQVREENKSDIEEMLSFVRTFMLVFALISIFVGAFIIFNTFSMLVAQRTRELALLRAIGAARGQVTRAVLGEAVAVGLVGSALGLPAGTGLAALLQLFMMPDAETGLTLTVTPVLAAFAVGVTVTVAAAYFPARRAAKIPPVAALRDDVALPERSLRLRLMFGSLLTAVGVGLMTLGLTGGGGQPLVWVGIGALTVFCGVAMLAPALSRPVIKVLGAPFGALFRAPGRLARRNALRNPRRTAATASALMIGLALISTVSVIGASARASTDAQVDELMGADYVVQAANFAPFGAEVTPLLARVPGVTQASDVYTGNAKVNGERLWYVSAEPEALISGGNMTLTSGDRRLGEKDMMIDEEVAKKNGWRVGSTVPVTFPDGAVESLRVGAVYTENQLIGPRVIALPVHRAHTPKVLPGMVVVEAAGDGSPDVLRGLQNALADYPLLEVRDRSGVKEQARQQVDQFVTFLNTLLVMSVVIAAVGVVNTLALSVIERTREIGLLRAIGTSRRQLRRMIRLESIVIAVFGAVLGIGIGTAFGAAIREALADEGLGVLSIPFATLAWYVLIAGVIGVLAALWPAWRAGRMDVLKAIATE